MARRDRPINPFDGHDTTGHTIGDAPRRSRKGIPNRLKPGPPMSRQDRARIEKARQPSKRNKLRSDIPGTQPLTVEPHLTAQYATQFVKLLHAGIGPIVALQYFAPLHYASLERPARLAWLSRWERDPLMARASSDYMKGAWEDLDKDSRLELALDKHMAELAYLLYTSSYADADGTALKKLDTARDAISQWIAKSDEAADTPYVRALKDLLEGKLEGMAGGPPRIGTSIPMEMVPAKKES